MEEKVEYVTLYYEEDGQLVQKWTGGPREQLIRERITRCRDCKHFYGHGVPTCQRNKEWFTGYDINGNYGEWCDGEFYVEPDGFCSWAERRA